MKQDNWDKKAYVKEDGCWLHSKEMWLTPTQNKGREQHKRGVWGERRGHFWTLFNQKSPNSNETLEVDIYKPFRFFAENSILTFSLNLVSVTNILCCSYDKT